MTTTTECLRLESITAGYGKVPVISGIDLRLNTGDTVAVVGANGAGKTTLLRAIMGEIPTRQGSVTFGSHPLADLPTYRRCKLGIGYVPEGRQLFPDMSVRENLEMGAARESSTERTRRITEVLRIFPKLEPLVHGRCGLLSGGEQQMVAIARALMGKPKLLLLDEPSTGLAPKIISELYATLSGLLKSGLTILVVEQNARAALRFAQRAVVVEQGKITVTGSSSELLADPRMVEAYMGMAGMHVS
ncbi:MAG TPA: ABC transporter ATP-binding protein [Castellaniella sp.]|uniref:ABC transporter ATP-binding protein n=1 Tax=Castellaniella sp. TaxID=1955812 RepID=UPI002F1C5C3B